MKVQVKKDNVSGPAMRLGRGGRDRLEAGDLASSGDGDPQEVQWGASSGSIDDLQAWLEVGSCNKSGTRKDACKLAEHDDGVK